MILREPVGRVAGLLGGKVKLGTVAGGQDGRLLHRLGLDKIRQRLGQPLRTKRHLLPNGERRGVMVQS